MPSPRTAKTWSRCTRSRSGTRIEQARVRFALLDTTTGRQGFLREADINEDGVSGGPKDCILSPDGKILVTHSEPQQIRTTEFWDVATGRKIGQVIGSSPHLAVDREFYCVPHVDPRRSIFTPDGKTILTRGRHNVDLSDVSTGKQIRTLDNASWPLLIAPDGKSLLALRR